MCCFSVGTPVGWLAALFAPKLHVSKTNIFARMVEPGVQALAYGMNLSTAREVAMVLPLPVAPGSGDGAVTFIDLQKHPRLFEELADLFYVPPPLARKSSSVFALQGSAPRLVVHEIGSFIASYVPARADFVRLDPRFRLPDVLFDAVPAYADYGFAVFQLAPGKVTVHPMALSFPTRTPEQLFFPTVHVHDGRFKRTADFDHTLYFQAPRLAAVRAANASPIVGDDIFASLTPQKSYDGLVAEQQQIAMRTLRYRLPNQDTWIPA